MHRPVFFDLSDHLRRISEEGDPLEEMARVIDREDFPPIPEDASNHSDGSRGGRPPYGSAAMFKIPIAARHGLSDVRAELPTRDRPS